MHKKDGKQIMVSKIVLPIYDKIIYNKKVYKDPLEK